MFFYNCNCLQCLALLRFCSTYMQRVLSSFDIILEEKLIKKTRAIVREKLRSISVNAVAVEAFLKARKRPLR